LAMLKPALEGVQQAAAAQLEASAQTLNMHSVAAVKWAFAYFVNVSSGLNNEADCTEAKDWVEANFEQVSTVLLPMATFVTTSVTNRQEFDVLVWCGLPDNFGQAMIQAQALNWNYKALITTFTGGTRSLYRYGGPFVNYVVEPLPFFSVLPNATDALLGSFDDFSLDLGFQPDPATLQAATGLSVALQALQVSPSTGGADLGLTLRNTRFETLFGTIGFDANGTRLPQPLAYRQFLASNTALLQAAGVETVAGQMNSNIMLVSPLIAEICAGDNSSVLCRDPVLTTIEYPMPGPAARNRQAFMCPDGTSLEDGACNACAAGSYRVGEMVSCEPCADGKYADLPGVGECKSCPVEAITCEAGLKPTIRPGFFVFEGEFAWLTSTGYKPVKVEYFTFMFSGSYAVPDADRSRLVEQRTYSGQPVVTLCSRTCREQANCIGFEYSVTTSKCQLYKDGVQHFRATPENSTWVYFKEGQARRAPPTGLGEVDIPEYPQAPTDLQYAICPSPSVCKGGTGCSTEKNKGLFCSTCETGSAPSAIFPASRECSVCGNGVVAWARAAVVGFMVLGFLVHLAYKASRAKATAAPIALPAVKLLISFFAVLGTIADSNALLLDSTPWLITRIPFELLLRPWMMMQIDCWPMLLEWERPHELPGKLHYDLVTAIDRVVGIAGLTIIASMSVIRLVLRLAVFFVGRTGSQANLTVEERETENGEHPSEIPSEAKMTELSTEAQSDGSPLASEEWAEINHKKSTVTRWSFGKPMKKLGKLNTARYRYLFMHEMFLLYGEVSRVIRRITIFGFWFIPVVLRTRVSALRCVNVGDLDYAVLVEHPDIICNSEVHDSMRQDWTFLGVIIAFPAIWALIVIISYHRKSEATVMDAISFVNAGYKYGRYWWDVLVVGRIGVSFLIMSLPSRILRIVCQISLVATLALLENSIRPWTRSCNSVLQKASNLLNAGLVLGATVAAWDIQMRQNEANWVLEFTHVIIMILCAICAFSGIFLLIMNVIFDEFFAPLRVLLQNGASTGPWTRRAYVVTAWLVGGLHELHLWRGADGRWVMDHSQLSRTERSGLVMLLVHILEQCLTLRGQFRMRQVETVLVLAFTNAAQVRKGTVQNDFCRHGTAYHPLTIWGFPGVTSQDPDIVPYVDLKVTLTELQTSLEMVSNDIQSGDPEVMTYTKSAISATQQLGGPETQPLGEVLVWDEDFQDIEGKVINHRQSQLKEAEAMADKKVKRRFSRFNKETTEDTIRRLQDLVQDEVDKLQREFDSISEEHVSMVMNALGERRRELEEDLGKGEGLAKETLIWSQEPLPPFDRGNPEVAALAVRKAEAWRHATLLSEDVLKKAEEARKSFTTYEEKAHESIQWAVKGVSVKGKRVLQKQFSQMKEAYTATFEKLQGQLQVCASLPQTLPPPPEPDHQEQSDDDPGCDLFW